MYLHTIVKEVAEIIFDSFFLFLKKDPQGHCSHKEWQNDAPGLFSFEAENLGLFSGE